MQKTNRQEISREGYVSMVWWIIGIGLVLNSIFYTLLIFQSPTTPFHWVGLLSIGLLMTGFGVGLAYARSWRIRGYE